MDDLSQQLFKYSKPVLRPFRPIGEDAGDTPYLWDAYKKGLLPDLPDDLSMADFAELSFDILDAFSEVMMMEDLVNGELQPVAIAIFKFDGWQIEPHILYFDNATVKTRLRTWVALLKKTRRNKKAGACLVRVEKDARRMARRIEQMGLLHYVGRIWSGRPDGNEYLYSMRCARRH